jgi:hypothetical protein
MLNRTLRCLAALGATSLMGGLVGCGSPATGNATPTTSATVALDLYDGNGNKVGSCAGTLIAADTVLTAGHCVVGKYWWQVTLPATGQTAHSSIAYTFDWQNFESDLSHPLHHDIGIIKLDGQMNLAAYPTLATTALPDGTAAMRVRPSASSGFEAVGVRAFDGTSKGFPNYYYTTIDATETLDTGTALIDPTTNQIYGVVSGIGQSTGVLYSSRVEMVADWLSGMEQCTAAATISAASITAGISADCHDKGPPPPPPCDGGESSSGGSSSGGSGDDDGGTTGSSSGSGSGGSSSGTTGGSGGSSSGGSSSGGSSSGASSGSSGASSGGNGTTGGDGGGSCGSGGGYCQGSGCGNGSGGGSGNGGGSGSSSGGSGSSSGASSGGNGTTGSSSGASGSGGSSSGASGSGSSSGASSGGNGTTGSSSSGSSSGGNGYNGGSSSGANGGGNGTTGDDDGSGGGSGGDNPGCDDSSCGGCPSGDSSCTDNVIDYGGSATSGGTTPYRPY